MLTLSGKDAVNARKDNDDIEDDIRDLAKEGHEPVPFGWYQEGYDFPKGRITNYAYIAHHNALQYFGYLRENTYYWSSVHDMTSLIPAIEHGELGDRGVTFVKGGYIDPFGFKPADKNPYVQEHFMGDDDHPGYSDSQSSEAMVAEFVNAIAKSKYWNDSLILITWDDSEGFYDHVPPPQFERCPDGHAVADHTSFIKMIDKIFNLPPLATLPDEAPYMPEGPRDTNPGEDHIPDGFSPLTMQH